MLEQAKRFSNLGFAVLWLQPKSKRPIQKKWTSLPRQSFDDLKKSYKAGLNIGTRLGKPSRLPDGTYLAVIDCDVKSADPKHLKELEVKLKELIPGALGPVCMSGRGNGSRHVYVKTAEPLKPRRFAQSSDLVTVRMPSVEPSRNDLRTLSKEQIAKGFRLRAAWEISLMGDGQQVVLPPSIHPDSGKAYAWRPGAANRLPLFDPPEAHKIEGSSKEAVDTSGFKPEPVDILNSSLSDNIVQQITTGEGVTDRSAAIFGVAIAMRQAGFSDNAILSCLTDRRNFLGNVGYDHRKTTSRANAADWVAKHTLRKAKGAASSRDDFSVVDGEEPPVDSDRAARTSLELLGECDWRTRIERKKEGGKPLASFHNIKLILENSVERGFIKHNEFNLEDTWLSETPWGGRKGGSIRDIDILNIKDYLISKYRVEVPKEKIVEVLRVLGDKNSFHPVRDYLEGLEWDGKPRLDSWLSTYLGVKGNEFYLQTVGRKTLTAMVARIFEPGIAFHHVLILEGKTRHGKSETWKILASKEWHLDNELDLSNKDSRQMLLGKWVVEFGELSSVHQAGVNSMKNFISNDVDTFRRPYGHLVESFKRQCIFVGTTNNERYLKDLTGNARYWPVFIDRLKYDDLKRDRDQLLAEAVANYQLGEHINFHSQRFYDIAEGEQSKREEGADVESLIDELLNENESLFPKIFRTVDVLKQIGSVPGYRSERSLEMKIGRVLHEMGFEKKQCRLRGIIGNWWFKKSVNTVNT